RHAAGPDHGRHVPVVRTRRGETRRRGVRAMTVTKGRRWRNVSLPRVSLAQRRPSPRPRPQPSPRPRPRRPARIAAAWRGGRMGVRGFRLLAGGQFASTIGDYCYAVALPWFVLSNHGSSTLLGLVLACYGLPRMVLIPVGGVLADKVGPRRLMMVADL